MIGRLLCRLGRHDIRFYVRPGKYEALIAARGQRPRATGIRACVRPGCDHGWRTGYWKVLG